MNKTFSLSLSFWRAAKTGRLWVSVFGRPSERKSERRRLASLAHDWKRVIGYFSSTEFIIFLMVQWKNYITGCPNKSTSLPLKILKICLSCCTVSKDELLYLPRGTFLWDKWTCFEITDNTGLSNANSVIEPDTIICFVAFERALSDVFALLLFLFHA